MFAMRFRAGALIAFATLSAGCGGGGGGTNTPGAVGAGPLPVVTPAPAVPVATPVPQLSAAVTKAITAASGGTVSTVLNAETVTVTVPAGALSQSTNVTLSVYAKTGLPRLFQSRLRRPQALPSGTTFITGMAVTIGAATLIKPLTFGVTGASNAAAGGALRLAASLQNGFGDIDTATQTNGTITEQQNPAYAGVALAGPSILYAFYSVPAANVLSPPAVTLSVSGPSSAAGGSQAQYAASETDANGFPFLAASYRFSVDSPSLGTIDATTGTLVTPTLIPNNFLGHVVATDQRSALTGSLPVSVLSSRPATAGDSISYAGTFSSSIANNAIASSPVVSTQAAGVQQTIAVSSSSPNQVVVTNNESDSFQLSTLTTNTTSTIAYQTSEASTSVRLLKSSATDSNNATYQTQYTPTSGLLTVEPENAGTFGPNDASQTYAETDPGISVGASGQNVTTTRTTAADGSYNETTTNADASTNTAVQNADGTGSYAIASAVAGPVQITFGLPTSGPAPMVPINLVVSRQNVTKTINAPLWYTAPITPYTESDSITASSAYDSRCNVPAKYGTASAKVTQAVTSVDAVYGNLETQTTTTYDVVGVGTVCSIFTDSAQTFYDYSGQEPKFITFNPTVSPILTSTTTEVLSIAAATISGQPVLTASGKRSTLSITHLAVVVGRERFRHAVRQLKITQSARMATTLRRMQGIH